MLRAISPSLLSFNFITKNASVNTFIPEIQVDFIYGQYLLEPVTTFPSTLASTETLAINNATINQDVQVQGAIITFGTSVIGSGKLTGSGKAL